MTGYFILGDPAYGLKRWLWSPYKGNLNRVQRVYNKELSRMRVVIERAFGRLKGRWRILLDKVPMRDRNRVVTVTLACCLLHNICEERHEAYEESRADRRRLHRAANRVEYRGAAYASLHDDPLTLKNNRDRVASDMQRLKRERDEWENNL